MSKYLYIYIIGIAMLLTSCYRQEVSTSDAWTVTEQQMDSISFYTTHHYTYNYNFLVRSDSLLLVRQQPSEVVSGMLVDTLFVHGGDVVVVADITTMPADTIDSVWVQIARDQQTIGWVRESQMLPSVSPDNPISQFIDKFSDQHLLIIMAFVTLVAALYVIRSLFRRNAKIVHFNDIPSFYPTLLALSVAAAAVFYSTIQMADPDSWRHYYYHPTLNPFAVPLHLGLFLFTVWAMVLLTAAAFDDIRRHLSTTESILYCLGLIGVCAVNYVVFSISTLYYIGYPLLVAYFILALYHYFRKSRKNYICGQCGQYLHAKGVCPHCGAVNI